MQPGSKLAPASNNLLRLVAPSLRRTSQPITRLAAKEGVAETFFRTRLLKWSIGEKMQIQNEPCRQASLIPRYGNCSAHAIVLFSARNFAALAMHISHCGDPRVARHAASNADCGASRSRSDLGAWPPLFKLETATTRGCPGRSRLPALTLATPAATAPSTQEAERARTALRPESRFGKRRHCAEITRV